MIRYRGYCIIPLVDGTHEVWRGADLIDSSSRSMDEAKALVDSYLFAK
jgi:hypothetical protein